MPTEKYKVFLSSRLDQKQTPHVSPSKIHISVEIKINKERKPAECGCPCKKNTLKSKLPSALLWGCQWNHRASFAYLKSIWFFSIVQNINVHRNCWTFNAIFLIFDTTIKNIDLLLQMLRKDIFSTNCLQFQVIVCSLNLLFAIH